MNRFLRWYRLHRTPVQDRIVHALDNGLRYGLGIMHAYHIHSGAFYPAVIRMETAEVITHSQEAGPAPRRAVYALTAEMASEMPRLRQSAEYQELSGLVGR